MKHLSVKHTATVALLIALQIVLSKFLMLQLAPSVRISIDSVPILLAGIWFGPFIGGIVGLLSDFIGTILFPTAGAYYPPLSLAFFLTGFLSGFLSRHIRPIRITKAAAIVFPAEIVSNLLFKSWILARLYGSPFRVILTARILPVILCMILDTVLSFTLFRLLKEYVPSYRAERQENPLRAESSKTSLSYEEALSYIHSITWRSSRLGLDRTRELLRLLGNPENKLKYIHVAGTNGKGSTCYMLASILQNAGYKVGLYTSPFVDRFNERIQIDFHEIPDDDLARITAYVRPVADSMSDHPTEFEIITAIGFLYFAEQNCDIVVLEVGMGGELDSTNVIPVPELAVITRIGLDHIHELGPDIRSIASAKAGIIKPEGTVVIYGDDPEAEAVFVHKCNAVHAELIRTDHSKIQNTKYTQTGLSFDFDPYQDIHLSLVASCQPHNAALVLTAVDTLRRKGWNIPDTAVRDGLSNVRFSARFELLSADPVFLADGSHNPQGISVAVESLRLHYPGRPVVFLLGVLKDKDVDGILSILVPEGQFFVTIAPDNPRALPAEELAEKIRAMGKPAESEKSIEAGISHAIQAAGDTAIICALGSLYYLGKVREYFGKTASPSE